MSSRPAEVAPTDVQPYLATGSGSGVDAYTATVGRVGTDVVGVEVHPHGTAGGLPEAVTATIEDGYYGAWWPGITEEFELTIHLADGTVVPNVPAFEGR